MRIHLNIQASRSVRVLFNFLAALVAFHLVTAVAHIKFHVPLAAMTELFDMDREANLPALYNVLLFMISSVLFFVNGRTVVGKARRPWNLIAGVFVFLGLDEGAQIHERLILVTLRLLNHGTLGGGLMGWLDNAWIIPYVISAALLLGTLTPWLLKMEPRLRWGLLGSGAVYVFGAVFLEAFSGKVSEGTQVGAPGQEQLPWLPCFLWPSSECYLYDNVGYVTSYTFEEIFEMTGLILCIGVLLRALERSKANMDITFGGS